jgi:hypothetical protein
VFKPGEINKVFFLSDGRGQIMQIESSVRVEHDSDATVEQHKSQDMLGTSGGIVSIKIKKSDRKTKNSVMYNRLLKTLICGPWLDDSDLKMRTLTMRSFETGQYHPKS